MSGATPAHMECKGVKALAKAYIIVYGVLHIIAPLLGLWIMEFGFIPSKIILIAGGLISIYSVTANSNLLYVFLSICFASAWVTNCMGLITWMHPWTNMQYVTVALMDFIHSLAFCLLSEVWVK